MQWFGDVQIFLVVILIVIFVNFVLFLIIARKRGKALKLKNGSESSNIALSSSLNELFDDADGDGKREQRVLFVLKDFSDLMLYFGPILFATLRNNCEVFVLNIQPCDGQRYVWLKHCVDVVCETMGFSSSNVVFVWDERFPDRRTDSADDPWPILLLMHIIRSYANLYDVDFVTTYDADGINDHTERQAINDAVGGLWRKRLLPKHTEVYLLTSASIVRSIAGIFDTPFSWISSRSTGGSYRRGRLMSSLGEILVLQRLYILCEWQHAALSLWSVIKVGFLLILNRYFLTNDYHKIQDEEKYRLCD